MSRGFKFCPRCAQPLQPRSYGEMPRLACPDERCGFVHWNNPVPVVAAVVERDGKVILGRNANWPKKIFALITGFLEKSEDPAAGVIREVKEELGLDAHSPTFIGNYIFEQMNQIIIAFHVLAEGEVQLGEELAEYREFEPTDLKPWPAATGLALRDWMLSRGLKPELKPLHPLQVILNFLPLGDRIGTAGQPSETQFTMLKDAGYEAVINLAPSSSDNSLDDEPGVVAAQGMEYVHIPVDWQRPTAADLQRFFDEMDRLARRKVFVHCAMNMRVSAFMFLWRVIRQGEPIPEAEMALNRIWTPEGHWQEFIEQSLKAEA